MVHTKAWPEGIFDTTARQNWTLFLHELTPRGLSPEEQDRYAAEYSRSIDLDDYLIQYEVHRNVSVERELSVLKTPLLVVAQSRFMPVSPEETRRVAEITPNAQYVSIDGEALYGNPTQAFGPVDSFLANLPAPREEEQVPPATETSDSLSDR